MSVQRIINSRLFLPVGSGILALYYTLPFLLKLSWWGGRDWDLFTTMAAVPVGSILDYGQFPFWNPYLGGGNILFHHPEVAVLSPFILLHLLFGAVVGLKLQVLICYFLGFLGSCKLGERLGLSKVASLLVAVGYFGSVYFALHFAEGHIPFTHFCFLPWLALFIFRSAENVKFLVGAGWVIALIVLGNGAAIPLLYSLSFLLLLLFLFSLTQKQYVLLQNMFTSMLLGLGLAAVKFLPMVIYLYQNKWAGNPDESVPLSALGSIFFGLKHSLYEQLIAGQVWGWHEYGAYISPLVVIMAVAALLTAWRRHWFWAVTALFFLLLGLGNFGWYSPWALLSNLPGFSSARCTGRAFQFVILPVVVLGAYGYDMLKKQFHSHTRRSLLNTALGISVAIVIGTNLLLAWPIMAGAFVQPPENVTRSETFRQVIDEHPQAYKNYLANRGSLITPWLSAYHPSRGLVDITNTVHREYVLSGKVDSLTADYTPNRIEYSFNAEQRGTMVIGMGFDPGWRVGDGRELTEEQGLISFKFEEGRNSVVLTYRTPYFFTGLIVSLFSVVVSFVVLFRFRKHGPG